MLFLNSICFQCPQCILTIQCQIPFQEVRLWSHLCPLMQPPLSPCPLDPVQSMLSPAIVTGTFSWSKLRLVIFSLCSQYLVDLQQVGFKYQYIVECYNTTLSIGLYARKNAIPSLTINDIRDVLIGFRSLNKKSEHWRESRSIQVGFIIL